ncbi:MAG: hypothetical protein RL754_340 [Bacteroidota bacterium]|jgi:phosphoesterase RecJ-like protein
MKEIRLDGFTEAFNQSKTIVITNHTSPDGDAMGSALGLKRVLEKLGKEVSVIVPNPYPKFLWHLAGNDEVMVYCDGKKAANSKIEAADMIFHLDYNAISRSADMEEALVAAKAKKVMIDHHRQPESWPDFIYSDIDMSSTCQMIYEFCHLYGWLDKLDRESAECLYTGLVTDTGSFRFPATTSRTMEIAGALMDLGVQPADLYDKIFDSQPVARLRLLGAMLDQLEISPDGTVVLLYLSSEQCLRLGYEKGITEGFVNYGLSIAGANMTCFLREEDGLVKISLRSKGDADVNILARASFNGGGHKNAAGGRLDMSIDEAVAYAKAHLPWN